MEIRASGGLMNRLLYSKETLAQTILRLTLGLIIFAHGAQKMLGWFGGYGFNGTMEYFTGTVGLPWIIGFLVIIIEFLGALFLISGFLTRVSALAMIGLFVGIILSSHLEYGFFMNWFGQLDPGKEGFEFHLLVIAIALALVAEGGGKFAADTYLFSKYRQNPNKLL